MQTKAVAQAVGDAPHHQLCFVFLLRIAEIRSRDKNVFAMESQSRWVRRKANRHVQDATMRVRERAI
jgi:hypothetical protein